MVFGGRDNLAYNSLLVPCFDTGCILITCIPHSWHILTHVNHNEQQHVEIQKDINRPPQSRFCHLLALIPL